MSDEEDKLRAIAQSNPNVRGSDKLRNVNAQKNLMLGRSPDSPLGYRAHQERQKARAGRFRLGSSR
jgi:hypothetical protein